MPFSTAVTGLLTGLTPRNPNPGFNSSRNTGGLYSGIAPAPVDTLATTPGTRKGALYKDYLSEAYAAGIDPLSRSDYALLPDSRSIDASTGNPLYGAYAQKEVAAGREPILRADWERKEARKPRADLAGLLTVGETGRVSPNAPRSDLSGFGRFYSEI